ncbi:MAG: hypothetical protein JXB10_01160 [Pirellulales bacterium]|nr:hypothetical protein [Pirellulales bacterium]
MTNITICRWWIALILLTNGLAWIVFAMIFPASTQALWLLRRAVAIVLGAGMVGCAYLLVSRIRSSRKTVLHPNEAFNFKRNPVVSILDGFLAFSIASFVFNLFLVSFRRYDFDPTFDVLHFIPTLLITNTVWEALISRSGGSLILHYSSVVLFDGMIGALTGLITSPLRLLPKSRLASVLLMLILFGAFEFFLWKWLPFRC